MMTWTLKSAPVVKDGLGVSVRVAVTISLGPVCGCTVVPPWSHVTAKPFWLTQVSVVMDSVKSVVPVFTM